MFIQYALDPDSQLFYVAVIVSVIVSIVLHELAHGWAAIWLGDDTPRALGHMTPDPVTHMGPISLVVLFVAGMAWGQMPVNESRMRGRYAGVWVAAAGPLTNLLLALGSLTLMAILIRFWAEGYTFASAMLLAGERGDLTPFQANLIFVLGIFGTLNLLLVIFNLMPVPPLDGSRIVAGFSQEYRDFVENPDRQQVLMLAFFLAFFVVLQLRPTLYVLSARWVNLWV